MRNILFGFLIATQIICAQKTSKTETYSFGQNGMELIAKSKNGMVIVSTFNAKMTIREEIARKVYDLYISNNIKENSKLTVASDTANVTGKCIVRKKNNLTVVDFYYEKIEWTDGLTEIYKKHLG